MKFSTPKTDEEIVAFQEKKAASDFVYATNQALQNLKFAIDDLRALQKQHVASADSDNKRLDIELELFQQEIDAAFEDVHIKVENCRKHLISQDQYLKDAITALRSEYLSKDELYAWMREITSNIASVVENMGVVKGYVDSSIHSLREKTVEKYCALKNEMLMAIVPAVYPMRRELEEKIAAAYIDFAGLKKEITINKQAIFVRQKEIENLHNIIEKMK